MRDNGFEVLMVSSDGPELVEVLQREQCRHVLVPMTRRISPWQDIICLIQLIRLFRKERPDIIHSHTPKAGLLSMIAAKLAGIRTRIHTVAGLRFVLETGWRRMLLINMERLTLWASSHIWVNSASLRRKLVDDKIAPESKIDMIGGGSSNGINLTRFDPLSLEVNKTRSIQDSIKYRASLRYLVCIGRIVRDKGINELVEVFEELNHEHNDLRLVLVGDYEDEVDPISDIARQKIASNESILVTGWTSDVTYYLSFATLLVHPSHREGFPNVLLQAAAMGCPVVCSEIDGNSDIVTHQRTGLLFNVKDPYALKMALSQALGASNVLKNYAAELRKHVVTNFDQPVFWEKVLSKYKSILRLV